MAGTLHSDNNGRAIQLFPLGAVRAQVTTADALTTAAVAIPSGAEWVEIRATDVCYINFGTSGVVAAADETSQLFPAGEKVQKLPAGTTHFAVIRASANDVTVQMEKLV
jgi:hypothetical protein